MTIDGVKLAVSVALHGVGVWSLVRGLPLVRRRWRECLLLAGSLVVAVGFVEVALRLLRPYESLPRFRWIASRRLHHVNPPSRRMFSGYVGGVPVVVETNEDGFRTRHTRASFTSQGVRVAVLGDSFAFGAGVNEPDAFPARLEGELQRRLDSRDVAVLNAGVISYSPLLERLQVADVLAGYRPTLVLMLLDATDIGDDFIYAQKAERGASPPVFPLEGETQVRHYGAVHELTRPALRWMGERLFYPIELLRAASGHAPALGPNYYLSYVTFEGQQENRFFIYRHPLERTAPYFEETYRHIEAAAAASQAAGARFVLVVSPRYHHWNPRECPYDWQRGAYRIDEPYQFELFRFFEQKRVSAPFPILDLLPAFRGTREFPLVFPNDPHWNPQGHAFVARTLADYLIQSRLLAK
jgi:hypothetical protein